MTSLPHSQPGISQGEFDNLLSRLDQGAAYDGYPEGFGFSWTKLVGDAATVIRRLRERCQAYKGQVEAGAAEIERLRGSGVQTASVMDELDRLASEAAPFGYARDNEAIRKILASARAALSLPEKAEGPKCLCCEEVVVARDGDECDHCRVTYSLSSADRASK